MYTKNNIESGHPHAARLPNHSIEVLTSIFLHDYVGGALDRPVLGSTQACNGQCALFFVCSSDC